MFFSSTSTESNNENHPVIDYGIGEPLFFSFKKYEPITVKIKYVTDDNQNGEYKYIVRTSCNNAARKIAGKHFKQLYKQLRTKLPENKTIYL